MDVDAYAIGFVTAEDGASLRGLYFSDDVGGTARLPAGRYRVRVAPGFRDYEGGTRMMGELLDEADVEVARKLGITGYVAEAEALAYNPTRVYFGAQQFTPDSRY